MRSLQQQQQQQQRVDQLEAACRAGEVYRRGKRPQILLCGCLVSQT
jgi:hypothetical protein